MAREKIRIDPGDVNGGVVLLVSLGALAIMAFCVVLAWELQRATAPAGELLSGRLSAPPAKVSGVDMTLYVPMRGGAPGGPGRFEEQSARADEHVAATRETIPAAGSEPEPGGGADGPDDPRRRLHGYGWADRARGRVHIPISRAMELYLAREAGQAGAP